MIKPIFVIFALLPASLAIAQQQSNAIDRISVTLGQCVGSVEQKVDEIADLKKQLAQANNTIKTMQEKATKPDSAQ